MSKKGSNIEIMNTKLKNGIVSNVTKERNYKFCSYKLGKSKGSQLEVYMIPTHRNMIIDILTKSGIIAMHGEVILKKVLSILEY